MNGSTETEWTPRARRCPGAIVGVWAWRAALAVLVAAPAAALVQRAFPSPPRGDAVLWDPGGHALLVFAARESHGLWALAIEAAVVLAMGAIVGVVPNAGVMVAIAHRGAGRQRPRAARLAAIAVARLPALAKLAFGVTAAQAALAAAAVVLDRIAVDVTVDALGEARAQLLGGAIAALFLPGLIGLGIVLDLARASVVRSRTEAIRAFFRGLNAWRRAPWSLGWAWAWRASVGLVAIAAAGALATRCGADSNAAVAGLAVVHQATMAARAALRVSWLAKALRSTPS